MTPHTCAKTIATIMCAPDPSLMATWQSWKSRRATRARRPKNSYRHRVEGEYEDPVRSTAVTTHVEQHCCAAGMGLGGRIVCQNAIGSTESDTVPGLGAAEQESDGPVLGDDGRTA